MSHPAIVSVARWSMPHDVLENKIPPLLTSFVTQFNSTTFKQAQWIVSRGNLRYPVNNKQLVIHSHMLRPLTRMRKVEVDKKLIHLGKSPQIGTGITAICWAL
jgi:hypothetical protein